MTPARRVALGRGVAGRFSALGRPRELPARQVNLGGVHTEYCAAVERPSAAQARLDQLGTELDAELATFAELLEAGTC